MNKCSVDLISVIVPVYNVEKYLRRCVDSIVRQTYSNLEIILVDDGSTDASGTLCDDLALEDSRIKVIHQPNAGLSCARNSGLEIYTGEYVCFIDSDDYISPDYIKYMYELCILTGCKMAFCNSLTTSDDNCSVVLDSGIAPKIYTNTELLDAFYGPMHGNITVAWNKLIHRSIVGDIRFEPHILHEDEATTFKFIYNAGIIAYTDNVLYYYYSRPESITGKSFSARNLDILIGYERRLEFYLEHNETELYNREYSYYLSALLINYYKVYKNIDDNKALLRDLHDRYKMLYNQADKSTITGPRRLLLAICVHFPLLYGILR